MAVVVRKSECCVLCQTPADDIRSLLNEAPQEDATRSRNLYEKALTMALDKLPVLHPLRIEVGVTLFLNLTSSVTRRE